MNRRGGKRFGRRMARDVVGAIFDEVAAAHHATFRMPKASSWMHELSVSHNGGEAAVGEETKLQALHAA